MLKQPSASSIQSGRSTPVENAGSGRATPSRLTRPASRLNKMGTGSEKKTAADSAAGMEASSDESEGERLKKRTRSNSEVRRVSVTTPPRSKGIPVAAGTNIPPGGLNFGRGLQKSAIHSSDSRLASPGSAPSGDISTGLRKISLASDKERSFSSSEPGTAVGDARKAAGGLQPPSQRLPRGQSTSSTATKTTESDQQQGVKKDGGEGERPASRLSKPSSLPKFGGASPGDRRKSPSGLNRLQQPLSSSQGFLPTAGRGSKVARGATVGEERGSKFEGGPLRESSCSSLEGSVEDGRPSKLEKQVSSTSSTGSTGTVTLSDSPKQVELVSRLVKPLAGGKDNRRISPEGMSPDRKTLSNESIGENQKNSLGKPEKVTKLIEETTTLSNAASQNGTETDKVGVVEVGVAREPEAQTPNLSQGSEVATDSTLSSLSLASVSSPPPSQPETGQAPYSNSASPLAKRSSSPPSQSSHDSHMIPDEKTAPAADESALPSSPRDFNPLRSPLAKEKEKAKRARSLSPKISQRVFPPQRTAGPSVNVSQYDASRGAPFSPPHLPGDRFARLELSRTDSPESVKSDVTTATAYSSSRKPLRSSLRAMKDKDSSSSSLDSGKVHLHPNKVTISPRSSQVVFLPEEAGLQHSAAYFQPTILSPGKRTRAGRPSSLSDNTSIDHGKRESTASEKMDYSIVEQFLTPSLGENVSLQRYDSTPEV